MSWSLITILVLCLAIGVQFALLRRYRRRLGDLDESERKTQAMVASLRSRLSQAQRLEAVGTYAGSITHNLNNLLSVILGHTRLTAGMVGLPPEAREELQGAMDAGHVAADLLADLGKFYGQADLGRKPTDLLPVVRDTVKLLADILPSTISITSDLKACGPVLISTTGIQQVLMNLCSNAAKAMLQNQGKIHITLHEEIVARPLHALPHELEVGSYAKLSIRDNGRGMDQENLERVLGSYYGDHPASEKPGLGLATVCRLMSHMQGVAIPHSQTGSGTTFNIYFPLIAWSIPAANVPLDLPAQDAADTAIANRETPRRILLVDDDEMVAEILSRGLRRLGHMVTTVTDSRQALETFAQDPRAWDLVITDQIMPHMSGVRLAREMGKVRPGIPIILTTGFQDSFHERQAREAGISAFVLKPCSHLDLSRTISHLRLPLLESRA